MNPTARALEMLRNDGWTVTSVERWVPTSPAGYKGPIIRRDAYGFADILAVKVGIIGATLVQVTTGSNASARVKKIQASAEAGIWLAAGNRILVVSFSKQGAAGKRKTWQSKTVEASFTP